MSFFLFFHSGTTDRYIIDEILVIIYSSQGTKIVLKSSLKPSLDGTPRNLFQIILELLMEAEAEKLKIMITDEDAERYIAQVQKDNNLSRRALDNLFKNLGYTYAQALRELRRKQMVDAVLEYKIKTNKALMIERCDVIEFYDANPEYEEANYSLAQTVVSKDAINKEQLDEMIKQGDLSIFDWEEPFTLKESEIADDKKFIVHEEVGAIVDVQEIEDGFELTRLVAKTEKVLIPLDERYDAIAQSILKERYMNLVRDYQRQLLKQTKMRFTYKEDGLKVKKFINKKLESLF